MVALAKHLGKGLYTPAEAAMYARVTPALVSRWFFGTKAQAPTLRRELPEVEAKAITFLDFVQTLAIRAIRRERSVPLAKIRQAINVAASFGIDYPFARRHTVYLLQSDLLIAVEGHDPVTASGKHRRQLTMRPVVEPYLVDLSFDADGLAERYEIARPDGLPIVMRPGLRFGAPTLETCGRTARTLWEAYRAEGSFEAAAEEFGVAPHEVKAAAQWYDSLEQIGPGN